MSADGPTVVVGNGMAGARVAAGLRARGRERVIVFGAETEPAYNRVLLSQVLAGKVTEPDVALLETAGRGVEVHRGHRVVAIDRAAATVTVHGPAGTGQVRYAHLVLATGSSPVIPALAGLEPAAPPDELPARVAVFRTLADCRRILAVAARAGSALVLGGGLLGLEAARGLAARGLDVRVVHPVGHLMNRQLDPGAGAVLVDTLTRLGITTYLDSPATTLTATPQRVVLGLANGERLAADLLVLACGVRPETRLAAAAGLAVRHGVLVDARLRTSDPRISAIGDCAEAGGAVSGLVAPAWEQAQVLARVLTGDRRARYRPPPTVTRLKADGIDLAAMGSLDAGGEQVTFADPARGTYARLAIDADRLVGAVLLGDNPAVGTVIQLFDRRAPVPLDRRSLLLGRATDPPAAPGDSLARMPDAATVCHCNNVRKGDLVRHWRQGARTAAAMAAATRATTGCGTCREAVAGIVDWLHRADPDPAPPAASRVEFPSPLEVPS